MRLLGKWHSPHFAHWLSGNRSGDGIFTRHITLTHAQAKSWETFEGSLECVGEEVKITSMAL
jgi:hypothetical protein